MASQKDALFEYLQWNGLYQTEKPYEIAIDDVENLLDGVPTTNLTFGPPSRHPLKDVRDQQHIFTLDTHGFAWLDHHTDVGTLHARNDIVNLYLPVTERLLRQQIEGADYVFIFDWKVS
jgi:hypothetical protein